MFAPAATATSCLPSLYPRSCARCNGEFIPEPFPAALLPPDHGVPPGILEQRAEFWVCARCSGVFWQVRAKP